MSEERLMILTMLQEGKITSDEASSLLQALDEYESRQAFRELTENTLDGKNDEQDQSDDESTNFSDDKEVAILSTNETSSDKKENPKSSTSENNRNPKDSKDFLDEKFDNIGEKFDKLGDKLGNTFDKLGDKLGAWGENIGEKAEDWGENIGEKAGAWGENIGDRVLKLVDKFLGDSNAFDFFLSSHETFTEELEKNIDNIDSPIVEIHGVNGKIILYSAETNSIKMNAKCSIKKSIKYDKPIYEIIEEDNKIIFKPRFTSGIGTNLEVYLPLKKYEKIHLTTSNGRIETKEITADTLILNTTNASTFIDNIKTNRIVATTTNASITAKNIFSENIQLDTSNSSITVKDNICECLNASTKNGRISIMNLEADDATLTTSNSSIRVDDCIVSNIVTKTSNSSIKFYDISTKSLNRIEARTSNSSIEINIEDHKKSYNIDAKTSLGRINIEIPNLIYDLNEQQSLGRQRILAHTANINESEKPIDIIAATNNGSIRIC